MIITTTDILDGYKIENYIGLVSANQVVGANIIADFFASFSDVFGGNSGAYRERLDNLYSQVVSQLEEKASSLGANAIIGLHIDFDEISGKGKSMFMVTAIGTAVSYATNNPANRYEVYKKLHELKLYLSEGLITKDEYEREAALIKKLYNNDIEKESQRIKANEEKLRKEKEIEEAMRMDAEEKLRQIQELLGANADGKADVKTLYGFNVDDVIEIKETGDCSSIDGFTSDGKVVCKVNGEMMILDINDIKLV